MRGTMQTQTIFKLFWLWEDEKEEAWLRAMANQGWHLKKIKLVNRYVFESGPARDVVYRLDWQITNRDRKGYLQLFQDAGWEYVEANGNWQYFRRESSDGSAPEIFSDNASKTKKYQSILMLIVIFLAVWGRPFLQYPGTSLFDADWMGKVYAAAYLLRVATYVLLIANALMLLKRILQLRKQSLG